jgi:hypothetical protein
LRKTSAYTLLGVASSGVGNAAAMSTMLVRELSHDTLWQLVGYGVLDLEGGHRIGSVDTQFTAGLSFNRAQQYALEHAAREAADTDITATAEDLVPLGTIPARAGMDAWMSTAPEGDAYAELIQELRKTAGPAIHAAWEALPIENDAAVNIPPSVIDLSALQPLETAYIAAVRAYLRALTPWWYRQERRRTPAHRGAQAVGQRPQRLEQAMPPPRPLRTGAAD